jgi:hypothetical protein
MSGLREFFYVWKRCGDTSYWKKVYPERQGTNVVYDVYVDPINAMVVSVYEHPLGVGGPAVQLQRSTVPPNVPDPIWNRAVEMLPLHMKRAIRRFGSSLALLQVMRGLEPWQEKTVMLEWFLENYHEQGEVFARGEERAADFVEPAREEILIAVLRLIGNLGKDTMRQARFALKEDLAEELAKWGVEC